MHPLTTLITTEIERDYKSLLDAVLRENPDILSASDIYVGQAIKLPFREKVSSEARAVGVQAHGFQEIGGLPGKTSKEESKMTVEATPVKRKEAKAKQTQVAVVKKVMPTQPSAEKATPLKQVPQPPSVQETDVKAKKMVPKQASVEKVAPAKPAAKPSSAQETDVKAKKSMSTLATTEKAVPAKQGVQASSIKN